MTRLPIKTIYIEDTNEGGEKMDYSKYFVFIFNFPGGTKEQYEYVI
jgi:hypothetical protein